MAFRREEIYEEFAEVAELGDEWLGAGFMFQGGREEGPRLRNKLAWIRTKADPEAHAAHKARRRRTWRPRSKEKAEAHRKYTKARYAKIKADPVKYAAYLARNQANRRNMKARRQNRIEVEISTEIRARLERVAKARGRTIDEIAKNAFIAGLLEMDS